MSGGRCDEIDTAVSVVRIIDEFDIEFSQLHNDFTSVTVYGEYKQSSSKRKGKVSLALLQGYNKDHRPDLKQEQDSQKRQRKIEKTIKVLDTLKGKVGTWKWKTKKQIENALEDIFEKNQSER